MKLLDKTGLIAGELQGKEMIKVYEKTKKASRFWKALKYAYGYIANNKQLF